LSFYRLKKGGDTVYKEVIRSRQNRLVKLVCSLERKKAREEEGLFRFDGIKLCREAIQKGIVPEYIFVAETRADEVCERIGCADVTVVSDDVFEKMSTERAPEGVITVAKMLGYLHRNVSVCDGGAAAFPEESERVFLLESVRDPGNLGTIIRTAASLGIDRLVLSSDCADIYNPKTIRAAMGALFMLRTDTVEGEKTAEYIRSLRKNCGRRIFGAALREDAKSLVESTLLPNDVFVIGNEGHGLSQEVIDACDGCVIIPMREGCESLNAAMAAGILMWETVRNRA
jgi:TrmH family RNA methyltransferase